MPDEVRDHLTRDQRPFLHPESLQILQTPSFMTVLLVFSSPTHVLQGSGPRTVMAIAEAWFCTQWLIFVLFLRFVFGLLYGWKIQSWPIIRFLTVSHLLIFYLLVFDRIHDAMCLNKMSRTSNRNIGPQHPNVLTLCINCGSIWKQVMEIYCQLRNRLYWRDARENRMWLIALP